MTETELTAFANQVKEVLVANLLHTKTITKELGTYVTEDVTVVVSEKGTLGKMFDKVRGAKDDGLLITVLRGHHEGK